MPKSYTHIPEAEWSFVVNIEDVGAEPKTYSFTASAQQRADMARRFAIPSIEKASASVTLQRAGGGVIHAMGTVRADLTQSCVISLAPVSASVEDEFEGWYGDKNKAVSFARAKNDREAKKTNMESEILEESVDPEPIIGGKIDIGELATQYLSLALDPYPQAEGAARAFGVKTENETAGTRKSPFEALKDWKEKR